MTLEPAETRGLQLPCPWLFLFTGKYVYFPAQGGCLRDTSLWHMPRRRILSLPVSCPLSPRVLYQAGGRAAQARSRGPGLALGWPPPPTHTHTSGSSARLGIGGKLLLTAPVPGPTAAGHLAERMKLGGGLAGRAGPEEQGRRSHRTRMSVGPRGSETSLCHPGCASGPPRVCAKKATILQPAPPHLVRREPRR